MSSLPYLVEGENVEAVVFAGAVPVLADGAEMGAEGFVEGLAGAGRACP